MRPGGGAWGRLRGRLIGICGGTFAPEVVVEEKGVVRLTGRVVVGVDGSEGSRCALVWALEEATGRSTVLETVIVWRSPDDFGQPLRYPVDDGKLAEDARRRLTDAVGEFASERATVEVAPVVVEGDSTQTVCQRVAEADLLVVGSRAHGTFAVLLRGSVGSKCAHHSPRPTVTVPPHRDMPSSGPQARE